MFKKLTGKKRMLALGGVAAIAVLLVVLIGSLVLRVDAARAQEIALAATGGGEIVAQEIDREGFWNEYSYDIRNGDVWYEVEISPFGSVTGMESNQASYGHWD